jgi:hypothetical protein
MSWLLSSFFSIMKRQEINLLKLELKLKLKLKIEIKINKQIK